MKTDEFITMRISADKLNQILAPCAPGHTEQKLRNMLDVMIHFVKGDKGPKDWIYIHSVKTMLYDILNNIEVLTAGQTVVQPSTQPTASTVTPGERATITVSAKELHNLKGNKGRKNLKEMAEDIKNVAINYAIYSPDDCCEQMKSDVYDLLAMANFISSAEEVYPNN